MVLQKLFKGNDVPSVLLSAKDKLPIYFYISVSEMFDGSKERLI